MNKFTIYLILTVLIAVGVQAGTPYTLINHTIPNRFIDLGCINDSIDCTAQVNGLNVSYRGLFQTFVTQYNSTHPTQVIQTKAFINPYPRVYTPEERFFMHVNITESLITINDTVRASEFVQMSKTYKTTKEGKLGKDALSLCADSSTYLNLDGTFNDSKHYAFDSSLNGLSMTTQIATLEQQNYELKSCLKQCILLQDIKKCATSPQCAGVLS